MLEPVALHQSRFRVPGLAADPRGVALGKQGALHFASLDALIGWLRILSDELPLDDLVPSLAIAEVRGAAGAREYLARFAASSSHLCDRAARVGATLGGLAFTGSGKHFVQYRDPSAPLGWDVDELATDDADFILYATSFTQPCRKLRDVPFEQLVLRLALRPVPGGGALDEADRRLLWLTARPGLAAPLLGYLHRHGVRARASRIERPTRSHFDGEGAAEPGRLLLARVHDLPPRMLALLRAVPGIALFRPVADNVAVEVGFRHPLRLESIPSVFARDRFYLFSGGREAGVEVIAAPPGERTGDEGPLPLADADRLVTVGFELAERPAPVAAVASEPPSLEVALRLVPARAPTGPAAATLVPWERAAWLKRLAFLLPPTVLRGTRVAAIEPGLLVVAEGAVFALPIGEPLYAAAPSVYLPVGWELLPRLPPDVLAAELRAGSGRRVLLRRGAAPIAVEERLLEPLSRRLLGRLEVPLAEPDARAPHPPRAATATVVNDPIGPIAPLPLWGYRREP